MCHCENNNIVSDSVTVSNRLDEDGAMAYSISQCSHCGEIEIDEPCYQLSECAFCDAEDIGLD